MTVQGSVHDIYWKNLPLGEEELKRPYKRGLTRIQKSILASLEEFPLEIELQDAEITSGATLSLEDDSLGVEVGELEVAVGHWLEEFDIEIDLQQMQVAYDKELFLDAIELELGIEDSQLEYGVNEDLEAFDLTIDGPQAVISISINVSPEAFGLEIDFIQPEDITVNTAVVFPHSMFDLEIELLDAELYVGIGPTLVAFDLSIDLLDISLSYGTEVNLVEESVLEVEIEDHETQWGTVLNIDCEDAEFGDLTLHYKTIITASDAKFANTVGPNSSSVIYGSDAFEHSEATTVAYWDFKVRQSTVSHSRGNRVNLVHIGPARPDMKVVERELTFVRLVGPNYGAGEWKYTAPEGYMSIINIDAINVSVVPDGVDQYELEISSGNMLETASFTDIDISEEL